MILSLLVLYALGALYTARHVTRWQRRLDGGRPNGAATLILAALWPLAWSARLGYRLRWRLR